MTKMTAINTILFIVSTLALSACDLAIDTRQSACHLKPDYDVQYIGHAFGKGFIQFQAGEDERTMNYAIHVIAPGSSEPNIVIKGIAQCQNGVVSGKFGGGPTSKAELSVLGGKFEGIFNHSDIETPFGRWNIALYDAIKEKNYDLSGYWQEISTPLTADTQ